MHRSRTAGLISGFMFGMGNGFIDASSFSSGWFPVLLKVLVTGLPFGIAIALSVHDLTRSRTNSSLHNTRRFLPLGIVGFIVGMFLYFTTRGLPNGDWNQLEPAPETPTSFVGVSSFNAWDDDLHVETASGVIYTHSCVTRATCSWSRADEPPTLDQTPQNWCRQDRAEYWPPPFFQPVRATYLMNICEPYNNLQINFVIAENGSVWHYTRLLEGGEGLLTLPLTILLSIVAGVSGYALSFLGVEPEQETIED